MALGSIVNYYHKEYKNMSKGFTYLELKLHFLNIKVHTSVLVNLEDICDG